MKKTLLSLFAAAAVAFSAGCEDDSSGPENYAGTNAIMYGTWNSGGSYLYLKQNDATVWGAFGDENGPSGSGLRGRINGDQFHLNIDIEDSGIIGCAHEKSLDGIVQGDTFKAIYSVDSCAGKSEWNYTYRRISE